MSKYREDGYKDVPNITLVLDSEDGRETFFIETVRSYDETYSTTNDTTVLFTTALMCPNMYAMITSGRVTSCTLIKNMTWRESEGEYADYIWEAPPLTFSQITLRHYVDYCGDPAVWEFELRS